MTRSILAKSKWFNSEITYTADTVVSGLDTAEQITTVSSEKSSKQVRIQITAEIEAHYVHGPYID